MQSISTMPVLNSLKWSYAAEIVSRFIPPLVLIILTRYLPPEDFGVYASAIIVTSFVQIIWESGLGKALVQRDDDEAQTQNVIFVLNAILGLLTCLLLYVFSERIAELFFDDERIGTILRLLVLQILFGSLSSVNIFILQKRMNFNKLFFVRFTTGSAPALISVPLVLNDFGIWSLVYGQLFGAAAQFIILWVLSDFRPNFKFDYRVASEIVPFGLWVTFTAILTWLTIWIDSIIIGIFLSGAELGLYRTGTVIVSFVFGMILGPSLPVIYSYLSRKKSNPNHILRISKFVFLILSVIAIPIAIHLFVFGDIIGRVLFNLDWIGIGQVLSFMGLALGYSVVVGANGEFYRVIGKPSIETMVMASTMIIYILVFVYAAKSSFETFLYARATLSFLSLVLHFLLFQYIFKVTLLKSYVSIFMITLISFSVGLIFKEFIFDYYNLGLVEIFICVIISCTISVAGSIILYLKSFKNMYNFLKNEA